MIPINQQIVYPMIVHHGPPNNAHSVKPHGTAQINSLVNCSDLKTVNELPRSRNKKDIKNGMRNKKYNIYGVTSVTNIVHF